MTRAWALPLVAAALSCGPGGSPPAGGGAGQQSAAVPGVPTPASAPAAAPAPVPAPVPAPAVPPALTAPGQAGPIAARVTAVSRHGAGILEVRVVLRNGGAVPVALTAGAGADRDAGALAAAVLEDAGGQYRTSVLRDGRGAPLCSADPGEIPPAGEREAWLRFAIDEHRPDGLWLRIPGLPPVELPGVGG